MITIASLVVDIAANQASLIKSVDQVNAKLDSVSGFASKVGTALAGAFTVTAVVALGKQVIDFAGQLTDLSAKTGISTTGLQKLGAVFEQSGISLDTVSSATVKLAKSLIDGDKSTVGALEKLGLSVGDLKKMAPEQQFMKVADAIGNIQNPTEKAWAAMQIFGKGGAELLAGFDGHLQEAAQHAEDLGLIIDEKTVKAADDFGDQLGLMGKQLLGIVATVVGPLLPALSALGNLLSWLGLNVIGPFLGTAIRALRGDLELLWAALARIIARLAELAQKVPLVGKHLGILGDAADWLRSSADAAERDVYKLWNQTDKVGESAVKAAPPLIGFAKANDDAAKAAKKHAEEMARLKEKIDAINDGVAKGMYGASANDMNAPVELYMERMKVMAALADKAREIDFATSGSTAAGPEVTLGVELDLERARQALSTLEVLATKSFGGVLNGAVARLPQLLQQAFTGGGGFKGAMQALASQIGGGLGEGLFNAGGLLNKFGNKLTGLFGDAFGLALPGIGNALGSVVGPLLGKLFGKFFNNPEKQVNPVRQSFIDAAGGLAVLDQRAHAAGVTLDHLLDAKTPEAYKRAIDELNAALQFQDDAMKTLEDTAQKYGFTIEELGPAFSRQQLEKKAGELYQDFMVLKAGGLDVDTILGRMGSSINDFVHSALKTGTEIPAAMAPMLQRMVELGQLTDENGNIITDLDAAGVHFSMTMTEGFEKVVSAVQKLTDAITRSLGTAIENIPEPQVTGRVHWEVDGLPIDPLDLNVPRFAKGGIVNGPTLAVIGEAGPEAVVPLSHPKGAVVAGGDSGGLREEFAAMRDHIERQGAMLARLPKDIARAVRDKRQLSLVRSRRAW